MKLLASTVALLAITAAFPAVAQDHSGHTMPLPAAPAEPAPPPSAEPEAMPGMDHSKMDHGTMDHEGHDMAISPSLGRPLPQYFDGCRSFELWLEDGGVADGVTCRPVTGSGTSRLPAHEGAMRGIHLMPGDDWMVMLHGSVSTQYTDHSGPRGDDKFYTTSMAMLAAEKETDWGRIQFKSMMSLEPLMDANGYPNLFATGETAGGQPLVDRQHPHDLFMELAARVDINIADGTRLFLYGGPVGEPALGPSAFMHRSSAKYNPEPPISHHWFDSTHITYGVATVGVASRQFQLETSLFTGREPDEYRWNIEKPRFDSWSVRATWNPTPHWALQASYGKLEQPEFFTHPGEDEHRFTGSAHYADGNGLSAMAAFSAKDRVPGDTLTAWLGEVNWDMDDHNSLFGRAENVANAELFPDHDDPLHDQTFRISKFQIGYARRIAVGPFELALGGSVAAYAKPFALDAAYGSSPIGYTLFAKLSLGD